MEANSDSNTPRQAESPHRLDATSVSSVEELDGLEPPRYTINLSLPPRERYQEVAYAFRSRVQSLPSLFIELLDNVGLSPTVAQGLARLCLRRVHATEETEELRGISQVTGIELYLLIALNVLLDLFMGCTSGGVRTQEPGEGPKMVHLRSLDWGMAPLRRVIVHLDFVKNTAGPVIASSITYVGYVGVLTGTSIFLQDLFGGTRSGYFDPHFLGLSCLG